MNFFAQYDSTTATADTAAATGAFLIFAMIFAFWFLIGGIIGAAIGRRKGLQGGGFWLGALFGPIGWILAAVAQGNRVDCVSCRELMSPDATVCPHCQRQVGGGAATKSETNTPAPPARASKTVYRVAQDGAEIGQLTPDGICERISAGTLTLEDHFLDTSNNIWRPLSECPAISLG